MRETQPMRCDCDLDDVTYICPCGASITVSGPGKLSPWIEEHRPHTNGLCVDHVTDRGNTVWTDPVPDVIHTL